MICKLGVAGRMPISGSRVISECRNSRRPMSSCSIPSSIFTGPSNGPFSLLEVFWLFSKFNFVIWNQGRLRSGLKTSPFLLDGSDGVLRRDDCGERKDDSLDDNLCDIVTIGCCKSDFHAGAHAQMTARSISTAAHIHKGWKKCQREPMNV